VKVALAMIARDAEGDLPACLASVAGLVDDIVIADTGSRDGTRACARRLGARVIEVRWDDDFAQARNQVLAEVQADWVLVLDADERLEAGGAGWRRQLESGVDAFQVTIRNYMDSLHARIWDRPAQPNDGRWAEAADYPAFVEHQNVRLFRRCPELYFVGRVHESVGPRVRAAGLKLGEARGLIHHFGLTRGREVAAAKNRYYRELGRRKAAEQPDDAQAQFELGVVEFDNFHNDGDALRCFERALRLNPELAPAWFYGGAALLRLGHAAEAGEFFAQARERGCRAPQLAEFEADAAYNQGRYPQAAAGYRRAARQVPRAVALAGKRGLAELRAGDRSAGLARLRQAMAAEPEMAEHYDRLIGGLIWLEDLNGALQVAVERRKQFPDQAQSYLRQAAILAQLGRHEEARRCLETGLVQLPQADELRRATRLTGPTPAEAMPEQPWGHIGLTGEQILKPESAHADRSA
jgi:tetratricopeptide (TPR) repeat protein